MFLGIYDAPPESGGKLILDATPLASGVKFSTGEHGHERLTAFVRLPLFESFGLYSRYGLPHVLLSDPAMLDGAFIGRLEDVAIQAGGVQITAYGYWRAFSDVPYTALWSKTTLDGFRPVTTEEGSAFFPTRFQFETQNRLVIMPVKGSTQGNTVGPHGGGLAYFLPDGSTRDIVGLQFAAEIVAPAANWRSIAQTRDSSFGGIANHWTFTTSSSGTTTRAVHVTFSSNARSVVFFFDLQAANTTFSAETGDAYLRISQLRIVTSTANRINTTLTANCNAGTNVTATVGSTSGMYVGMELVIDSGNANSEIVTVLSIGSSTQFNATFANNHTSGQAVQGFRITPDEVIKDVVARIVTLNPSQLSSNTAHIESQSIDLLNEQYEDASGSDVVSRLVALGDNQARRWVARVWGRHVYVHPNTSNVREWYVDATDLQIDRSLDLVRNSAYAVYTDANQRQLRGTVETNVASVARYGVTRRVHVPVDTTNATQANYQRDLVVADGKDPAPKARVTFNRVYDAHGVAFSPMLVRTGDTITIRNLPPIAIQDIDRIRTFRIAHTEYDCDSGVISIEPEGGFDSLEFVLARQQRGIA